MQEVFAQIGVTQFAVRFAGAPRAEEKDGIQQLREDFPGYPIDIKR